MRRDDPNVPKVLPVRDEAQVYAAISAGREMAIQMGFDRADQTRLETIIAELARNAVRYGGGGALTLQRLERDDLPAGEVQLGLQVTVEDRGPGIANLAQVLAGRSEAPHLAASETTQAGPGGLGVGIAVVRRLADEFAIESMPGRGTRVRACKWRRKIAERLDEKIE
jgi:serine/threonine-protein kinase RsbT